MSKSNTIEDYKKNSVFFGVVGKENVDKGLSVLNEVFPDHHIHIMDSEVFNQTVDKFIRKVVDWKEAESIREFTSKAENIQGALANALKIKEAVGNDFFTAKQLKDNSAMSFKQVKAILDLQYAFGFLVKDTTSDPIRYKVVSSKEDQIEYLQSIISSIDNEKAELIKIIEKIEQS